MQILTDKNISQCFPVLIQTGHDAQTPDMIKPHTPVKHYNTGICGFSFTFLINLHVFQ